MPRLSEGYARYRRLPSAERRALRQAVSRYGMVMGLLRTVGFKRCAELIQRNPENSAYGSRTSNKQADIEQTVLAVQRAHKAWRRGACLDRALTLCWLLQRAGVPAEIHLGVRKCDDDLDAHAWVECNGERLGDDGARGVDYAAFDTTTPGFGSQ